MVSPFSASAAVCVKGPLRYNISERNVYRAAFGLRGDIGSLSESFFRNLSYDAYYSYAKTEENQPLPATSRAAVSQRAS